jgi:hypothetical protein
LVAALITVILSGVVSYFIVRSQIADSDNQAKIGQQATAALQLESAATAYYDATITAYDRCVMNSEQPCELQLPNSSFPMDADMLQADRLNVFDTKASNLTAQLLAQANKWLDSEGKPPSALTWFHAMTATYHQLTARCSELAAGRT